MTQDTKYLRQLEIRTQQIYNTNSVEFDAQRDKSLFEKKWLDTFASHLQNGDTVLDVGCGSAEPISAYLNQHQFAVTGVDFSHSMLHLAKQRFPHNNWILQDMRQLNLKQRFHGLISWNAFFHLTQSDQRSVLEKFNEHLLPGGILLLTVGHENGEVIGTINEKEVYHSSLSRDEYIAILQSLSFQLLHFVARDPDCQHHSILMAKKQK